ncbi:2-dehydro-3-deoxygalactonokinase [Tunicatimonas pelagia]|uniref:2-dehydro-3-deoxygalactonokinase n=1 Tax=Tunicatimonas pelagia TaxID=931531 RepID=UPI002666408A|nr:2-dehydro-3-deoxygalactonokinase [Tunicatimonas pelagia]WKN42962.1 2-dehydro-3-deoxygalactonokinase [Tunicatimonas pelagia]
MKTTVIGVDCPMNLPEHFISCDWGTSNFRLRVVETHSLEVLAEHKTDRGIKAHYEKYQCQQEVSQFQFFAHYLKSQRQQLPEGHRQHRIVVAGMASSNIGLWELPYATLPFSQDGKQLVRKQVAKDDLDLLLISGVRSTNGIMRGEEVQAVGLEEPLRPYSEGILLLPGTHSKHITFANQEFRSFRTYMTGELFDIISKQSILSRSVEPASWSDDRAQAFQEGLELGFSGQLSASLFTIRANHIISKHNPKDSYYQLSGMLIGDELAYLKDKSETIILAAPDPVFSLYQQALKSIIEPQQLVLLGGKVLEKALLIGQKKILALHGN